LYSFFTCQFYYIFLLHFVVSLPTFFIHIGKKTTMPASYKLQTSRLVKIFSYRKGNSYATPTYKQQMHPRHSICEPADKSPTHKAGS